MRSLGLALALASATLAGCGQPKPADDPLRGSLQVLLVLTDGWDAVDGTMQRFERSSVDAAWRSAGPVVPIVVGRGGLAWGRGVASRPGPGPVKREGDGKSPAGVFRLSTAFGQTPDQPSGWQLPYRYLSDDVECVDDARSAAYNRLTTRRAAARVDWSSSEKMWQEPLYKWGVAVDHNTAPQVQPAGGSCIFLHIWKGPGRGTAGCTAMEEPALTTTIAWLAPKRTPLLVQLPRAEYERLTLAWRLP
jgi:L,D-peptidoglycan transpeptidase YkuD (ErfK/YbiS/YcfS/YnhG family)